MIDGTDRFNHTLRGGQLAEVVSQITWSMVDTNIIIDITHSGDVYVNGDLVWQVEAITPTQLVP